MRSLAIVSQKGGVGKTSVALNTAYAFAFRGHRTLLVDTDPQGAIGGSLKRKGGGGLLQVLTGERPLNEAVTRTRMPELEVLLTGTEDAAGMDALQGRITAESLQGLLGACEGRYDLVVVDTPSGMYGISKAVVQSVGHVLVPLQAEPLAFRTVHLVLESIAAARESGHDVRLVGFVLTMLQMRCDASARVAQEVWRVFPQELVLETTLPRDPVFLAASQAGVPLGLFAQPAPPVAHRFEQLAIEIEPALGLTKETPHAEPLPLLL